MNLTEQLFHEANLTIHLPDENAARLRESLTYYRCALMEVETKFKVLNEQLSLSQDRNPIESIEGRIKTPRSILKKLDLRMLPLTLEAMEENIFDVAGCRVTVSFLEDIYRLADSFLLQDDIRLIERKDYIKNPKPNGYRSLHLIIEIPIFLSNEKKYIKVEVQFRTIAMDFWASLEHKIRYKKSLSPGRLQVVDDELLECAGLCASLDSKMQKLIETQKK